MTTVTPNPHSPYADADPTKRHIFPTPIFFGPAAPGVLALAGCERLAVVPDELTETAPDNSDLPDGLCPACLAAMRGEDLPEDARQVGECRECGTTTDRDGLCVLCRQEKHEKWWPTRASA